MAQLVTAMFRLINRIRHLNNITSRILWLVLLLIFLSSCLHLISYMFIEKNKRIDATKQNLEYALTHQTIILESWAGERAQEIRYLANLTISKELQLEQMARTFQNFVKSHDELASIVFLNKDGYVVIDSARKEPIVSHSDISLEDRDYFKAGRQGREYLHDVVVSKATGKPAIIFSSPVLSDDDHFLGVMFGAVHLSKVNELLSQSILSESGEITLVNQDGAILTHLSNKTSGEEENQALADQLNSEIVEIITGKDTGKEQLLSYVNRHGEDVYGMVAPLFGGRYYLINELSKREVFAPYYEMIKVKLVITSVILVVGILLIVPVAKHFLKPLLMLVNAIHRVKAGNYSTQLNPSDYKSSPVELQEIMQTFNEMTLTIQEHHATLRKLSSTDGLTGVANRRAFEEYLEREWLRAQTEQRPLTLAFVDVDHFKEYNDHFGHQVGDQCLMKIANAIQSSLRKSKDVVARYGGDEFVLILPDTDCKEATLVAKRVRKQIEDLRIQYTKDDVVFNVTVSIGVASLIPPRTMEKEALIELADQAVYEAKSQGRNKIVTKKGIVDTDRMR